MREALWIALPEQEAAGASALLAILIIKTYPL